MVTQYPGASRTFEAISKQGYSPQTALADVVDNSVAAGATRITVDFVELPDHSTRVFIGDNGKGMSFDTLSDAMQLGSSEDLANGPLSRFGYGMKAASLTFSPKFSVISRKGGATSYASWDKRIQAEQPFEMDLEIANDEKIRQFEKYVDSDSGTLIVWEYANFNDDESGQAPQSETVRGTQLEKQVSEYLGFAFHRYISGEIQDGTSAVEILINGDAVTPWNPVDESFLVAEEEWIPETETLTAEVLVDGVLTTVEYFLTVYVVRGAKESTPEERAASKIGTSWSGLFPYREGRALQEPTWDEDYYKGHANLNGARIILEYTSELDGLFHTPVNKSKVVIPNAVKSQIGEKLKTKLADVRALRGRVVGPGPDREQRAHEHSNAIIRHNRDFVESPTFEVQGDQVLVTNNVNGPTPFDIAPVEDEAMRRRRNIELVDDLVGGALFEPKRRGLNEIVVRLNRSHEFYKKIYLPLLGNPTANAGLDLLLYAFTNAELLTSAPRVRAQFENMRNEVSRSLNLWVSDLEYEEDDDETDDSE
jgi:hypothetical protein